MSKEIKAKGKNNSGDEDHHNQAGSNERTAQQTRPGDNFPSNHVFVGKKPVMSYAMSALIQLAQAGEIVIKARGMVISSAVDVAEIVTKRLGNNAYAVKNVAIGTERVGVPGEERNVSTIEIIVGKIN